MIQKKILNDYWDGTLQITNKPLMYWLMERGLLGNTFRVFNTEKDLFYSKVEVCTIRCVGKPNLPCIPWVDSSEAFDTAKRLKAHTGYKALVCECDKFIDRKIQGELQIITDLYSSTLEFYYTYNTSYMRQALLEDGQRAYDRHAYNLLKNNLDENSYGDIMELLDRFPNHVIELTIYNENVGIFNRPYVIWEIRAY